MPTRGNQIDDKTIISPEFLFITTELQNGPVKGIENNLFPRYLEVMGHTQEPIPDWLSREDLTIYCICNGLGFADMKFSDIINQALVAGGLKVAAHIAELEKKFKI